MENKNILELKFKTKYEAACRYVEQNNLDEALECFISAFEHAKKLSEMCFGNERNFYTAKKNTIKEAIIMIKDKMSKPTPTNPQPPQPNGANNNKPNKAGGKPEAAENNEPKPKIPLEESLKKLDELIGLGSVKKEVRTIINFLKANKMREEMGLGSSEVNNHIIFAGSPGTGKTTVARIMADIFYSMGLVEKGQLVEVQREDLVAGFVGQTGPKTQAKIDEAIGGVFFIDEIYRLSEGGDNDFGKEAVGVILTAVENRRNEFITILAGYEERMKDFIDMNPGLASRFPNTLHFEDYTVDELYKILEFNCKKNNYVISDSAAPVVRQKLQKMYDERDEQFGNARSVRNFFDKMVKKQASRVVSLPQVTKEILMTFMPEDVPEV